LPSNQFFKRLGLRPLALRLLGWVLLYSLILSLVATGVQMIGEFERQKSELQSSQERAADLIAGGMSTNLWVMNFSEVANSLDDMRSMPFIGYARVITTTGEEFSTGSYPEGRVITQTFPLEFNRSSFDRPQRVGELTIVSSIEQVYQDILDRALLNLLFQSIVVMLGTLGLLLIVRVALSRHLETMADYAAKLNLDALVEPLKLRRRNPSRPDELSELEQALNKMRLQILEDIKADHHPDSGRTGRSHPSQSRQESVPGQCQPRAAYSASVCPRLRQFADRHASGPGATGVCEYPPQCLGKPVFHHQ